MLGRKVIILRRFCNVVGMMVMFLSLLWIASPASANTITGQVSNSSGSGIAGVWVYAYDNSGNYMNSGYTQADGSYTIAGLPTGSYKLAFCEVDSGYVSEWYNNKTSFDSADAVAVTAGSTTSGINATLALGGSITGQVTNSSGSGIAGVWVNAYDASMNYMYSGCTQADGSYTIAGLPAGSYKLDFYGVDSEYLHEWYNNKTSFDSADAVAVTAGSTTGGINATLALGGSITGQVSNSSGSGIAGVWVYAYDASMNYMYSGYTQADGSYTIAGLPTGSYKLEFYPGDTGYVSEWYNNKTSFDSADAVAVTAGSTTGGINAVLTPSDAEQVTLNLTISGSGSGTVTSTPTGIAANTSVSQQFDLGAEVTLQATPAEYSLFTGWSGDCSGTGDCILTMDGDKNVTATFTWDSAHQVLLYGSTPAYYATILEAYQAAAGGDAILTWGTEFSEDFTFNQDKAVALIGGYDSNYTGSNSYTLLNGVVTIRNGSLRLENLVIR